MGKNLESLEIYGVDELKAAMDEIASETGEPVKAIRAAARKAAIQVVKPYLYESAGAEYTAKPSELKKRAKISAKSASNLYGYILRVESNRLGLERFERKPKGVPKQAGKRIVKRRIVVSRPKRDGSEKEMKGIFIARMKSGHVGLFRRTAEYEQTQTDTGIVKKQKIQELISLSLSEMSRKTLKNPDPKRTGIEDMQKAYIRAVRENIDTAKRKREAKEAAP